MTVGVKFDLKKTLGNLRRNRERGPRLIAHALNRAAVAGRAVMARDIAGNMKIAISAAKDAIRLEEATPDRTIVRFFASAKRIPVIDFKARGPIPSRGRGRGVTARTPAGRYPHAFIARVFGKGGGGGHLGVFERKGTARLPIRELFGASIAYVFPKHAAAGVERAREQLQKNLAANLRFLTSGASAA